MQLKRRYLIRYVNLIKHLSKIINLLFSGMSDISPAKRMAMANSLRFLQDVRHKTLNMLKTDR